MLISQIFHFCASKRPEGQTFLFLVYRWKPDALKNCQLFTSDDIHPGGPNMWDHHVWTWMSLLVWVVLPAQELCIYTRYKRFFPTKKWSWDSSSLRPLRTWGETLLVHLLQMHLTCKDKRTENQTIHDVGAHVLPPIKSCLSLDVISYLKILWYWILCLITRTQ